MNNDFSLCIVAVGYSRPDAINRLLESLKRADYEGDKVDLMISIDKGPRQKEVIDVAQSFNWEFGDKKIRAFSERQGLRNHILKCGDVVDDYDAVVVLEDDISVSKYFYSYVKQSVAFYGDNDKIGGISLYKHQINTANTNFFEPEFNGFDVYFMQYAQSWGQCWTKNMWQIFRNWYNDNVNEVFVDGSESRLIDIPKNIRMWGNHSWLRYFMVYISENDLYFVYPHHSLSTNHTEVGQHNSITSNSYQLAMSSGRINYRFPTFDEAVKYDMFFERIGVTLNGFEDKNVILDLYGVKENFTNGDILVSTSILPFKVIKTLKLKYRPHEINCILPEEGTGIFVYDLHSESTPPKARTDIARTQYEVRAITWRRLLKYCIYCIGDATKRKIKK